jgi:lysophospholipid acyltransferase (LPLAT)-like uncharacterized protein
MKRALKRFLKSDHGHRLISWVGAQLVRVLLLTSRKRFVIPEESRSFMDGEQPVILAVWHSRILLTHQLRPKDRPLDVLVSHHQDGRLIGRILERFELASIYGSTSRGGDKALRALIRANKAGHNLGIAPDGPRGPAGHVSEGVAQLAVLTHTPVIALSYAASRHSRLNSWDRFVIPYPFSTLYFIASAPIYYEESATDDKKLVRERLRQTIEKELHRITEHAEALATHSS